MVRFVRKLRKKEAGFTLIELMVVVIILGILAGALVPTVISKVGEAKKSRYKADLDAIATAARMYYIDQSAWPADIDVLEDYGITSGSKDPWDEAYSVSVDEATNVLTIDGGSNADATEITIPAPTK